MLRLNKVKEVDLLLFFLVTAVVIPDLEDDRLCTVVLLLFFDDIHHSVNFVQLKTKHGKFIYIILYCSYILCTFTTEVVSMLRSELGMQLVEARQVVH